METQDVPNGLYYSFKLHITQYNLIKQVFFKAYTVFLNFFLSRKLNNKTIKRVFTINLFVRRVFIGLLGYD